MSEVTKQIEKMLNDEALQHAMSKEALQKMLDELDGNEIVIKDLNETIEALNENEKKIRIELRKVQDESAGFKNSLIALTERATKLDEREAKCQATEIRNEFEHQRGNEFKELMHATVRNATVRKTIFGEQIVTETPSSTRMDGSFDPGTMSRTEPVSSNVTETEE